MNAAFALTVLTGVALFLYDPIGTGLHTMFLPKLVLIALGLVHAYGVERTPLMKRQSLRRLSAGFALVNPDRGDGCLGLERGRAPAQPRRCPPGGSAAALDAAGAEWRAEGTKIRSNSLLQVILICRYKFANDNHSQLNARQ